MLLVRGAPPPDHRALGRHEDAVKQQREQDAGNRRRLLRKEIDRRGREQRQRDQSEANREFRAGESDVERHPPRSWKLRSFVTEHQHRQRFEGEAPHDAERVRLAENVHVPATDQNREHLQQHDQIDQPVRRAVAPMGLSEPVGEDAVLGDAIQDAVGAHDRGIHRASEHQKTDDDNERLEKQARRQRSHDVHRQAGNEIVVEVRAHVVGNDRCREEAHERREEQAVDDDHEAGTFQVLHLRMLDLAVHLRQRLLAAHCQNRMAEPHHDRHGRERRPDRSLQPPERIAGEMQVPRRGGGRKRSAAADQKRQPAPGDHEDDHHGHHLHDAQRVIARFVHSLCVPPPEIAGDQDGHQRRRRIDRQAHPAAEPVQQIVDKADDVLACRHAADRPGQDVIEEQGRDR